jgi:hypothetical protein
MQFVVQPLYPFRFKEHKKTSRKENSKPAAKAKTDPQTSEAFSGWARPPQRAAVSAKKTGANGRPRLAPAEPATACPASVSRAGAAPNLKLACEHPENMSSLKRRAAASVRELAMLNDIMML